MSAAFGRSGLSPGRGRGGKEQPGPFFRHRLEINSVPCIIKVLDTLISLYFFCNRDTVLNRGKSGRRYFVFFICRLGEKRGLVNPGPVHAAEPKFSGPFSRVEIQGFFVRGPVFSWAGRFKEMF